MDGESAVVSHSQSEHAAAAACKVDQANLEAKVMTEAPESQPAEQETGQPDVAPETTDRASHQGRRSLKLVLTLAPIDGAGFSCLLAVGADDRDPLLQSVEVADLSAALQEAASLVAAAEERWQSQPRNPASIKKTGGASAKRSGAKQQSPDEGAQKPATVAPESDPAQPGQLPLFG
jgi:hypothetical protein